MGNYDGLSSFFSFFSCSGFPPSKGNKEVNGLYCIGENELGV